VLLPSGSPGSNNTIIICIGVTDSIGSTTYKFSRAVTVRQPELKLDDISSMLSSESGALSELLKKGNPASLASFTMAVMGTLNSLESPSSQETETATQKPSGSAEDAQKKENQGFTFLKFLSKTLDFV